MEVTPSAEQHRRETLGEMVWVTKELQQLIIFSLLGERKSERAAPWAWAGEKT